MATLSLKNISKKYDSKITVLDDLSLDINDKEFVVLVGPSGCGKSTILRIIAGLEEINQGEVFIGDKLVNDLHPKDRDIAMVFQNYALYPHMTVYDNMAFGLKMRKFNKDEIDTRVKEAAKTLALSELLQRKPKQLSGGQRQRVALGRAIVRQPAVFLMDEPLSNLDAKLRTQMRSEIKALHRKLGTTFIYVTHDQTEAMTMGDKIVVLNEGRIQQQGSAEEIYNKPKNAFTASFIGSLPMNLFNISLQHDGMEIEGQKIHYKPRVDDDKFILGVRPEDFAYSDLGDNLKIIVKPTLIEKLGSEQAVHFELGKQNGVAKLPLNCEVSEDLELYLNPKKLHFFNRYSKKRYYF